MQTGRNWIPNSVLQTEVRVRGRYGETGWDFFINYCFILIILLMKWSYICESEAKTKETNTILKQQIWSFLNFWGYSVVTVYWNVFASPCEVDLHEADLCRLELPEHKFCNSCLQAKLALRSGLMLLALGCNASKCGPASGRGFSASSQRWPWRGHVPCRWHTEPLLLLWLCLIWALYKE